MTARSLRRGVCRVLGLLIPLTTPAVQAQLTQPLDSLTLSAFPWREIGPANMAGRITDIEGLPSPSRTFYVATAGGGIFKTINGGTTFRPLFQNERCASMGDLAIAPSDTSVIYAGTGEPNSRNSISPGCGIFKSTDGGLTWKHLGLTETRHIARVIVHPTDPNTVWVAALGHAWGANQERGLYKTTDGGASWELVKFVSDKAGFVDMVIHPTNPDLLFASSYERVRGPYFLQSGGPGSALWKTADGGRTWIEVKGGGFPETTKGRIGLAIARSNPQVMYALVEADTMPNPRPAKEAKRQVRPSGLYRSADGGATWAKMADNNVRPFYYSQVRVDVKNPDRVYWSSTPVNFSDDGGKTVRQATQGIHVDHHAMWLDPANENHFIVGNDGGVAVTWDKGGNYDFLNQFAIGQFYAVSFDMAVPYRVCGGLQDNGSWCGPSRRKGGSITNAMWSTFNGGDGFVTQQDPGNADIIYGESQGGRISRFQWSTGERSSLQRPDWQGRSRAWDDSVLAARPDSTRPETPEVKRRLAQIKAARAADSVAWDTRWNWNTPFIISAHNPATLYFGANRVLKSTKRGDEMFFISGDLTSPDTMKIRVTTQTTGGITPDVTGAETYHTIVSLAESPLRAGLLYAGTDDGSVWITRNDGGSWENLAGRFPGAPAMAYVSRIEPSSHDTATFFVTFDNHRRQDFAPYVYMTADGGKTFRSIAADLPTGGPDFVHVIRESSVNRNLLFVGTDVGVYVSANRGSSWQRFMTGLPTTPVHDLKIHPRERELIAGTHGRSIWIVDIGPLEELTDAVLASDAHLFTPGIATQWGEPPVNGESPGHKVYQAASPAYGTEIVYRLKGGSRADRPRVAILDAVGDTVAVIANTVGGPGIHRATWDYRLRSSADTTPLGPTARRDSILIAQRRIMVFDSLEAAKSTKFPKPMLDRVRDAIEGGDAQALTRLMGFGGGGGGGGGRGGARPGQWVERPGESPLPGAGRGPGGPGGAGGAGVDTETMRELAELLRPPGIEAPRGGGGFSAFRFLTGGRGGGGFGGGGRLAGPGDYVVSFTLGSTTLRQRLRVERASGGGTEGGVFEED